MIDIMYERKINGRERKKKKRLEKKEKWRKAKDDHDIQMTDAGIPLVNRMNLLIPQVMAEVVLLLFFYKDAFGIK